MHLRRVYAESAEIFGKHKIFRDCLQKENNIRRGLLDLFDVLNTPINERDPYLDETLKKFLFINGGLFSGSIEIPNFTPDIKNLGAVFESTLNPETRRSGFMHYISLDNIHKVIDPLFLNELQTIKQSARNRKKICFPYKINSRTKMQKKRTYFPAMKHPCFKRG